MNAAAIRSRPWLAAGGAGALLLALVLWCSRTPEVPVDAAVARRAALRVEVSTNGTVEPVPDAELRVHARMEGRIERIPEPGTKIEAGDVLLELDGGPVAAELAAAESERLQAEEALATARRSHELVRRRAATDAELFQKGALTPQLHAESRARLAEARERLTNLEREVPLRVASLDLRVEELRAQLAGAEITAPFGGTVYRTAFKPGELVRVGDPVLWLADLSRLRVRANIDQVDLGRVRTGQRVRVTSNAWPDRDWVALVSELVPHVVVKDNRSVSEGLAEVQPPTDGLVPGMTVDVDIVVAEAEDVLQVPVAAVRREGGNHYVYRVAGGRAERAAVEIGRASVTAVEILSGIAADDVVIVSASNGLRDGSPVDPQFRDVAAR
jgi:HlyD family secretion protein